MFLRLAAILFCFSLISTIPVKAQAPHANEPVPHGNDTIRVGGVVTAEGDTLAMVFLPEFTKTDRMPRHLARRRAEWDRLHYNVYKVYPYAVIAAEVLKDVDVKLAALPDKAARKEYLKSVEKELNKRFKGELEDLTITQGQILVKLIDRQTGKNCFSIIKELKGGFSAVIWQSVALLFSNNLKREYDPYDRDKDIEAVVQEIEHRGYYKHP
ncbi:DUF4294 domain-containing protein [Taibaiella soli]|uniref:DUF4294 domain-containing protein n=1 Tax=Taibaiella soli TaxID=1649169 RepID=A0A2W2B417_9BACT|nr:DUF4294 domain-containing protein [Taibaiella soli]PZF74778.1 DUF4294 domain-containing protein [Taibaiella soli]